MTAAPTGSPGDFEAWLEATRTLIDADLLTALGARHVPEHRLDGALRHAVLLGGKRLRPTLTCAACEALGGDPAAGRAAGVALELVHAYSLVHDDLPAMDDDALRRGHPTVHVAFDEATAILAGDGLLTLAFDHLATTPDLGDLGPDARLAMIGRLARAAGPSGMVAGQALDMAATGHHTDEAALARIHAHKTGALITAAAVLGGLAAGIAPDRPELAVLETWGDQLGLAFQIVDDLLDATAATATLGKTAGADAALEKSTYVGLLGIDGTRSRARDVCAGALRTLDALPATGHLPAFVHWVLERDH
jgi:geranylgeranyl pyrophosphate synthase